MSYVFSSTKSEKRVEQVLPGRRVVWEAWEDGVEVAQTMYTHVSKCKNDKIKGGEKRTKLRLESSILLSASRSGGYSTVESLIFVPNKYYFEK
jgi:hypothetical protein